MWDSYEALVNVDKIIDLNEYHRPGVISTFATIKLHQHHVNNEERINLIHDILDDVIVKDLRNIIGDYTRRELVSNFSKTTTFILSRNDTK